MHNSVATYDQAENLRRIVDKYQISSKTTTSQMVTITSGKGGVGKSTISANLASKLAEAGKSVCLFDADSNLANLDVLFGISTKFKISSVLRGDLELEDIMVSPSPNLFLIPGSSGELDFPQFDEKMQLRLIEKIKFLKNRFDYIFIDTSAGISKEIVAYATHSDYTIIVTNSEPTSIVDAYALIKVIALTNKNSEIKILVNNVINQSDAERAVSNLQLALKKFLNLNIPYIGIIPADYHVQKTVLNQKMVVKEYPNSAFSLSAGRIADKFLNSSIKSNLWAVK